MGIPARLYLLAGEHQAYQANPLHRLLFLPISLALRKCFPHE